MAFPPLRNSDHVVVSVSIDFPINSQQDALFHHVTYDYSCGYWDGAQDHLRDVSWDHIFNVSTSTAASEFCEWVQVGIDVYIPHHKHQVRSIPPQFNGPEVLSSASDKAKLIAKIFSNYSNLDDSGVSLPVFPSRTNLKLHNISIAPKMVKKVIANLDSSKASGPNCIPVVVLKNCEPELSYMLAEIFNMFLKESCFPDCWKVSLVWSLN